jgi:hypothetical protein
MEEDGVFYPTAGPTSPASGMVSRHVFELCTSPNTLITALEKEPDQPVSKLVNQLFRNRGTPKKQHPNVPPSQDDLDLVAKCGNFPYRPSNIFLQVRFISFFGALL